MPVVRFARRHLPSVFGILGTFVRRLTVTDTTLAEFQSSTTFLAMAMLMLDPYPTLTGVNVPIFVLMLHITSEFGWGIVFLCVGVAQSLANLLQSAPARKVMAFVAASAWGLLFALGCFASPPSFFVPVCGAACFVQCLVYLRLGILQEAIRRA